MPQTWKAPHIIKGALTYVPGLNQWRRRRAASGGTNSARYCYAVWMRHLVALGKHGFSIEGSVIGELGPGDSIGTGLAGLLAGAERYVGLDIVPYSSRAAWDAIFMELVHLYDTKARIPDHAEFPRVRPQLASYDFPDHLVSRRMSQPWVAAVKAAIRAPSDCSSPVAYKAPWTSISDVQAGSLDLIFSQAVLQYVHPLDDTYRAMFTWLKPGGYASHATGLGANDFAPHWNGHWAYTDREWRLVRGRREVVLNREPLSRHLDYATRAGFEVVHLEPQSDTGGLPVKDLTPRFRALSPADLGTRGAVFILRKPETRLAR